MFCFCVFFVKFDCIFIFQDSLSLLAVVNPHQDVWAQTTAVTKNCAIWVKATVTKTTNAQGIFFAAKTIALAWVLTRQMIVVLLLQQQQPAQQQPP